MDIKIIISMFEELKKQTSEQFSNLSKLIESKVQTPQSTAVQQVDLSVLEQASAETTALIKAEFKQSRQRVEELAERFSEKSREPLPPQKHLHAIELHSSKTVLSLVSLTIFLLCSIIGNISQYSENNRLNHNDIKFRYIKALGEATSENILQLEAIFEYEPDKQKQRTLRQRVEQHERAVAERARALEEANIKATKAEQLRREAEKIKQKE
ncbi:MAG: hypothetical protein Q4F97_01790 [Bacteroidales bacterium]|nr:hypothetical protein [Bacteroidales bacterium]